jgi:hypothetical protein
VVLYGLTFKREAYLFRTQAKDRRLIKPFDFFKAGLISGDSQCVQINRIVRSNGFRILPGNKDLTKIAAIQRLFTIVDDYGYETLDDTLHLISSTWDRVKKASGAVCLLGVAEFVSRYGLVDFVVRMKGKFKDVYNDYTEADEPSSSRDRFCCALVTHYNKGLVHNSKKRLIWEG